MPSIQTPRPLHGMRRVTLRLMVSLSLLHAGFFASANTWPDKQVRLVVGYPPGGTTDIMARLVATQLSQNLHQQFVVENRAGASGMIAANAVAKAKPDGLTLLFSASQMATWSALYDNTPFDVQKDFAPVALVATTPYLLVVHPSLPVRSLEELVAYAREHPGEMNYAASSPGGAQHLGWEMFKRLTQTDLVYVPYSGSSALMPDLLAGRLQAAIDNVAVLTPYVRSGALRALAITGPMRSPLLPDVPTALESGLPGFDVLVGWFAIFAPAGTPEPVVTQLAQAIRAGVNEPSARQLIQELGASAGQDGAQGGAQTLRDLLATEMTRWGGLIHDIGIKLQ